MEIFRTVTLFLVIIATITIQVSLSTHDGLESVKVIIVGGGASGIAAAAKLVEGGINDFLIVEGGVELGGRVASRDMGQGRVELGAQYIHGEKGNIVHELAKQWGMLPDEDSEDDDYYEAIYDNGQVMEESLVDTFYEICEDIYDSSNSNHNSMYGSLGEYFEDQFEKKLEERKMNETVKGRALDYMQYYGKAVANYEACGSWFQLGLDNTYMDSQGNQYGTFKKEYFYIDFLNKLGSHIDIQKSVRFNEKVLSITEGEREVVVKTDKKNYTCQYVVLTVSLGVLKHGDITFIPPLPAEKQVAIDNLGFGTIGKILLEYPQPWAEIADHPDYEYSFLRRNEHSWKDDPAAPWEDGVYEMDTGSKNPTVVILWTNGHSARKASLLPPAQLLREANALMKKFFSLYLPNLPSPISAISPKWSTNPLVRGTYSFNSPSFSSGDREALAEPTGRKLFAGEATNNVHYATVHGAIETGRREANRILAIFNGGIRFLAPFNALSGGLFICICV